MARRALPSALLALWLPACGTQVYANNGLTAQMQVSGGQFYPGSPPAWFDGGIAVAAYTFPNGQIYPGEVSWPLGGSLFAGGVAVALHYPGDVGYWTLPASAPNGNYPGEVDFATNVTFARTISTPPGDAGTAIILQAIDSDGGFGPPLAAGIQLLASSPVGPLVITLSWDLDADLDLHVVEPDGTEIWRNHQSDYKPNEVTPAPPIAQLNNFVKARNAYLDFDSNAQCVIDGRRIENVIWGPDAGIQSGTYTVRVDTFSLCAQKYAYWEVGAFVDGGQIAGAMGESLKSDEAYYQHGAMAGVTAFTFTVP
jgi:hypothetical protein